MSLGGLCIHFSLNWWKLGLNLQLLHHNGDVELITHTHTHGPHQLYSVDSESAESSNVQRESESMRGKDAALAPVVMLPLVLIEPGTPDTP